MKPPQVRNFLMALHHKDSRLVSAKSIWAKLSTCGARWVMRLTATFLAIQGRSCMKLKVLIVLAVVGLISLHLALGAAGPSIPKFEPDPYWPKHLPNNWILGQVSGVAVDSHDNI